MEMRERRRPWASREQPATITSIESDASVVDRAVAADVLLRHIFVPPARTLDGIEYAAIYRFAEQHSGGDVIDMFRCCDGTLCFSLTDISGKGVGAALHAGLVKYGMRAYANEGHNPAGVLRQLNRFYRENDEFEGSDSFATVLFARYEPQSRCFTYASAGHEGMLFLRPGSAGQALPVTGPVVGILDDNETLYNDNRFTVERETMFVAVSDGVTEARKQSVLFEMAGLMDVVSRLRDRSTGDLACSIARAARSFAQDRVIDDMAVLAVRFN
jgi:serine phosphatase RsbU (regulator of sigma subunit)